MSPIFTTFVTSIVSTVAVPYLEKRFHISIPASDQTAVTAGCVGAATASAHWIHLKLATLFRRKR